MRIVSLERDSVKADFRAPAFPHDWVEHRVSTEDEVVERLAGADIAIVNKLRIGAAELAHLPGLPMSAVVAIGADNIDLAGCAERGIVVSKIEAFVAGEPRNRLA